MNKKILLYFGDYENKKETVVRVLQDMRIPFQILQDEDLVQYVGYLMDLEDFHKNNENYTQHYASDLMILQNIEDDEILKMNQYFIAQQCSMKRKAMLTTHNQHWKVCDLLLEIEKEHLYFSYVDKIQTILTQSSTLVIEDYTKASWLMYEQAFMEAYEAITKESSLELVSSCYQCLLQAKKDLKKLH